MRFATPNIVHTLAVAAGFAFLLTADIALTAINAQHQRETSALVQKIFDKQDDLYKRRVSIDNEMAQMVVNQQKFFDILKAIGVPK